MVILGKEPVIVDTGTPGYSADRVEEKLGKQRATGRPPAEDPKVVGFAD